MTYDSFKDGSDKSRLLTRKDMMIKHMLTVKGMSVEKAAAVTSKFPTWIR